MIGYFDSRAEAGAELAGELLKSGYRWKDTTILALDAGGIAVGYQIAIYLHANLRRFLTEEIRIDDESVDFATVLPGGEISRNSKLDDATYEYYYGEYAGDLEEKFREAASRIDARLGMDEISPENLRGRNVILVSDGVKSGEILHAVIEWMKPARAEKIILAAPIISVDALDDAHILMDELHILSVPQNFANFSAAHYYDENDVPTEEISKQMIAKTILNWR